MRRLIGFFATAVLLCSACGGNRAKTDNAPAVAEINTQAITITENAVKHGIADTLHFGKMRSGEIIAKRLRVKNGCNHPIVLLRHTTTCGCIKITYDRKPITPNGTTDINFEFDTRTLHGWQMKLMEFYFAEKGTPMKIYAEAEVE